MTSYPMLFVAVIASLLAAPAAQAQRKVTAETTTVQVPEGFFVREASLRDVDGDGLGDLVIAAVSIEKPRVRKLRIHLRRRDKVIFVGTPDREITLKPDVVAFAVADVRADPGNEIVLFNSSGAFVMESDGKRPRPKKLFGMSFVWQLLDDDEVMPWNRGVVDLDGDGLDDLLIPEPDAFRVAFQDRDEAGNVRFERVNELSIPLDTTDLRTKPRGAMQLSGMRERRRVEIRLRVGTSGGNEDAGPLLEIVDTCPAPQLADWDGDGDLDLMARTVEKLHVWIQDPPGRFASEPRFSFPIPVTADRSRLLDVSYSAHVTDMNGDKKADCVFVAGNQKSEKVRTQVLVFLQDVRKGRYATTPEAPLFGPRGLPQQLVPLAGFAALPSLEDVNRDGRPDLAVASFRPDLLDIMRSQSTDTIEVGFHLFLNRRGLFSRKADVSGRLKLRAKNIERATRFMTARFFSDVNGDGMKDLLVQDSESRLKVFAPRRSGRAWVLPSDPDWTLGWDGSGRLRYPSPLGATDNELMMMLFDQILHVRFAR